jgi:hypothetical protein
MDKNNKHKRAKAAYWSGSGESAVEFLRWMEKWKIAYVRGLGGREIYLGGTVAHVKPGDWLLYYPDSGNFVILSDAEFKARGR